MGETNQHCASFREISSSVSGREDDGMLGETEIAKGAYWSLFERFLKLTEGWSTAEGKGLRHLRKSILWNGKHLNTQSSSSDV